MSKLYYDWNTKNRTFVRVAEFLQALGVKNYKFPLVLYDRDLSGIDPFDPKLSPEMQAKVVYEASRNKMYFIRELVKIREQGAADAVQYEAHVGNITIHFLRQLDINSYLELPRQCGKSIVAAVEFAYVFLFGENTDMGCYNYNNEMVKLNISRIYSILNELPFYMHFHKLEVKENVKDPEAPPTYKIVPTSQTKKLSASMRLRNNNIMGKTPGINAAQADEAGRGATMLHQWWDEPCQTRNFDIAASAAFPAFVTASMKAKKNGAAHSIMITSTPPDIDSKHGEYLQIFVKQNMAYWNLSFFDYNREQLETHLKKYSKNSFFYVTFQYEQVFKDREWYEKQLELIEPDKVRREILLIWEKEITGNPYSVEDLNNLDKVLQTMSYHVDLEIDDQVFFKIYCNANSSGPGSYRDTLRYIMTKRVIIASDVAGGSGGKRDYSTLVGIDPITSDLLFTFKSNTLDPNEFSKLIHKFVTVYCPKGIICMERNSYGRAVLANLRDKDPSRGIPNNLLYMPMSDSMKREGGKGDRGDTIAGIYTLEKYRERLFLDVLSGRIKHHKYLFRSKDIYNEICSLTENKNGRIDHKSGAHDDLLFAYMIGQWVLTDAYYLLEADYPDIGGRKIYKDMNIDHMLVSKDKDPSMDSIYQVLSDLRNYYEDIVDSKSDIIDLSEAKQGVVTIQKFIEAQNLVIEKNGGILPGKKKNKFARFASDLDSIEDDEFLSPMPSAAVIKEAEKINDSNRRNIAQGLGISDAEYNYIINTRNKVAADVHIDFDDDGKPVITRNDSVSNNGPQYSDRMHNKLKNIFGNRRS